MKRILFVDCIGGASGDMWLGALAHLGVPMEILEAPMRSLNATGWVLQLDPHSKNGIEGIKATVQIDGESEHPASFGHPHGERDDHGVSYAKICALLGESEIAVPVRDLALAVFENLAIAEGKIHGVPHTQVHFHEVGALDALVDILGVCAGIVYLNPDEIILSSIPLGSGTTRCAHGTIPVPVPATLEILQGLETFGTGLQGEMVTPTGAALLKTLGNTTAPIPKMKTMGIGYGIGQKDWPDRPNVLRLIQGENTTSDTRLIVMETNIDDMNPEWFAPLTESLFERGALDVWCTPIQMKKGRLATLLSVLAPESLRQTITEQIFRDSTTLGIRSYEVDRDVRQRRLIHFETSLGSCRFKIAETPGGKPLISAEFDDCVALGEQHQLPVRAVTEQVMQEVRNHLEKKGEHS